MTTKEAAKVLKHYGLPEFGRQVFTKGCLYVLPIGLISSGVCFERSSDQRSIRLVVFEQPLYIPRDHVVFWKYEYIDQAGRAGWYFDPEPTSQAALDLCQAIRERCLPLAEKRLSVEGALEQSLADLERRPGSYYVMQDVVLSLCMLGQLERAWSILQPMMNGARNLQRMPRPKLTLETWDSYDKNFSWADNLYSLYVPLEEAFLAPDPADAVRRQLEVYIGETKHAIGLAGVT